MTDLGELSRQYQCAVECHRVFADDDSEQALDAARRELEVCWLENQLERDPE